MAETKKPVGSPITDVSRPGKSAPSSTSKPVIISNRPILKDPMMIVDSSPDNDEPAPSGAPPLPKAATTKAPAKPSTTKSSVVQPLVVKASEPEPAAEEIKEPPVETKTEAPVKEKDEPEPTKTDEPREEQPTSNAEDEAEAEDETNTDETELDAEAAKQAEHDAAIAKVVDSHQYFLPINTVEKRRSRRFVALGILVSLLLAAAWLDVALDSGIVKLAGIKAPTHFFSSPAAAVTTNSPVVVPTSAFTSLVDGLNFKYPSSWQATKSLTSTSEAVSLGPPATAVKSQPGVYSLSYDRNQSPSPVSLGSGASYSVAYVSYTKLPVLAASTPLYDQQFILKVSNPRVSTLYQDYLSLTTTNTVLKDGQAITSPSDLLAQTFSVNGESDKLSFGGVMTADNSSGNPGSATLSGAESFKLNPLYIDANNVLLSFRAPATK